MKSNLLKAAVAISTIVSLGSPVAFAAKNQHANVDVSSRTRVTSVTTSFSISNNDLSQNGGKNSNQNARQRSDTNSVAVSSVNAFSGNFVIVNQD